MGKKPVPFGKTERINDLRVALSSIKTLARDGSRVEAAKTLNAMFKCARHALERDTARAALSSEERQK
jgi:hypothetical protein